MSVCYKYFTVHDNGLSGLETTIQASNLGAKYVSYTWDNPNNMVSINFSSTLTKSEYDNLSRMIEELNPTICYKYKLSRNRPTSLDSFNTKVQASSLNSKYNNYVFESDKNMLCVFFTSRLSTNEEAQLTDIVGHLTIDYYS